MYEITRRPLTQEERERVGRHLRDAFPAGCQTGCSVLVLIGLSVFGFLGGGLVAVLAALVTGNLEHVARFVLWGGGVGAGLLTLRSIVEVGRGAIESRREARAIRQGTHDLGDARVIRCEASAAACWYDDKIDEWGGWILDVGDNELIVLCGNYAYQAHEEHGFPHAAFELAVHGMDLVLEYRADGPPLEVREIDPKSCTDNERRALEKVADQAVLRGTIETCVADIAKQYRAWRE
jgi:hypothetical protein